MSAGRATAWVAAAGLLSALVLGVVASLGQPFTLVLGPADREYTRDFQRERSRGAAGRWAKAAARIEMPLRVRRPSRLSVKGGRPGLDPARIELQQDGEGVELVLAGEEPADLVVALAPAGAIGLALRSREADRNLSLQISRVTVLPSGAGAVVPEAGVMVRMALGAAALAAVFLAAGFAGGSSLLFSLGLLAAPLCLLALGDPFAAIHLARKASLFVPLLTAPALLLSPGQARRFVPVLAVALALRCAIFHPRYDYQDVEIHHQVTRVASREGAADLWRRMTEYQQRYDLGRASSGTGMVPFPYPPTFYNVAALVPIDDSEEAMKLVALMAQGVCVLLVMALAGRLLGPGLPEVAAGLLAAVFPPDLVELLRASYPAILGHAVDLGVVTWLVCRFSDLRSARGILVLALALAAAALTYNAAPVHFGIFVPTLLMTLSLRPPLEGRRGLALAAVGGAALSLAYYGPYLRSTLTRAVEGHDLARAQATLPLARFVGQGDAWAVASVVVSLAGAIGLLRRTRPLAESRVLLAWLLYPVAILLPVWLSPEPFRYFRLYYFAYPLLPLLAASLCAMRRQWTVPITVALLGWSVYEVVVVARGFFLAAPG